MIEVYTSICDEKSIFVLNIYNVNPDIYVYLKQLAISIKGINGSDHFYTQTVDSLFIKCL